MPKIAVCIVTGRSDFYDWLLWNITKQKYKPDYLSIVFDRSKENISECPRAQLMFALNLHSYNFKMVTSNYESNDTNPRFLGDLRNQAIEQLKALPDFVEDDNNIVTWFDDDDWYSEDWLSFLKNTAFASPKIQAAHASSRHRIYLKKMIYGDFEEFASTPALPAQAVRWGLAKHCKFAPIESGEEKQWYADLKEQLGGGMDPQKCFDIEANLPFALMYQTLVHNQNTWNYNQDEYLDFYKQAGLLRSLEADEPITAPKQEWAELKHRLTELKETLKCI